MDMLVPVLMIGSLLVLCFLVLAGSWTLVKNVRTRGWHSLVPRFDFSGWNRFWFTPTDPTVLGLIRILCGAITTYTVFAYTFMLQDFMGKDSWYDLSLRSEVLQTKFNSVPALDGLDYPLAEPSNKAEEDYKNAYKDKWRVYPPAPFPSEPEQPEHTITNIAQDVNSGIVAITTADAHGFAVNDPIGIHGVKGGTSVNGVFLVFENVSANVFTLRSTVFIPKWAGGGVASKAGDLDVFKLRHGYDLRYFGLKPPQTKEELQYIDEYMSHPANFRKRPPPAYPNIAMEKKIFPGIGASAVGLMGSMPGQGPLLAAASLFPRKTEKQDIYDYMAKRGGADPRLAYSIGQPSWSIWFHVTDPAAMNIIHTLVILVTFLFTIGFCTRVTSALTWITSLWYIHRNPVLLFGVDTMMVILLLYLMIGPSGAALSVDRLIARWWSKAKPGVVNRWRALFGRPALAASEIQPAAYSPTPVPSVSANFAIRMLQIHLCIIYLVSGISKLIGPAWWSGNAVWGTLANFEFAPMTLDIYNVFLRWLGGYKLRIELFLTGACYFTLAFEVGYAFLIWRPRLRWVFLSGAIILHGFIGLLMGLKTFSLMMLVMNMGFLRREEIDKFLRVFTRFFAGPAQHLKDQKSPQVAPIPARTAAPHQVR